LSKKEERKTIPVVNHVQENAKRFARKEQSGKNVNCRATYKKNIYQKIVDVSFMGQSSDQRKAR
jgi:hypothetical protein